MKFHPEEYKSALEYWEKRGFPHISEAQYKLISEEGKNMIKFHLRHPAIHNLISLSVFIVIFVLDWWVLMHLGKYVVSPILGGIIVGIVHSYIMYNLTIFTIHEGAAHKLIIPRNGSLSKIASTIVNNLGRIALAESDYYAKNHLKHHSKFTTPEDPEYLYFVYPKRLFKAFIPFASILNIGDFKVHTGYTYTPSRFLSIGLFLMYHAVFVLFMSRHYSWIMIVIAIVMIAPNTAFWLDRLRQYTEHNLMPLHVIDGARDLGLGFWGMLIGGGPWGQPCHWTHHLVPGVPWYNQLRLHNIVKKILTFEQKKAFFLRPFFGFPALLLNIIKITGGFQK